MSQQPFGVQTEKLDPRLVERSFCILTFILHTNMHTFIFHLFPFYSVMFVCFASGTRARTHHRVQARPWGKAAQHEGPVLPPQQMFCLEACSRPTGVSRAIDAGLAACRPVHAKPQWCKYTFGWVAILKLEQIGWIRRGCEVALMTGAINNADSLCSVQGGITMFALLGEGLPCVHFSHWLNSIDMGTLHRVVCREQKNEVRICRL